MSSTRNLSRKYGKQLLDTASERELDPLKTASEKLIHEAAEVTGEFIRNKIANKIVKSEENSKKCWKNKYFTGEKRRNNKWIKRSIIKWNTAKYLNY